ncbi:hypothetical protein HRbin11_02147 [bacterium HR11]|nr:hypothetical protein HRbin11_02147 [bacterium HR11]
MKGRTCVYEDAVRRAARTGRWDEALRDHVAGCDLCRDVAAVTRALQALAQMPISDEARLPDPALIWWKARLLKDWSIASPRFGALLRLQDLASILGMALLAGVLWMYGPTWQNAFVRFWMTHVRGLEFPFADAVWRALAWTLWAIGIGLLGTALAWALDLFQTDGR